MRAQARTTAVSEAPVVSTSRVKPVEHAGSRPATAGGVTRNTMCRCDLCEVRRFNQLVEALTARFGHQPGLNRS